jgi:hypothetical protein
MAVIRILLEAGFVGLLCYSMYASYRLKHYGRVALDVIGIFLVLFVIVALRTA